MVYRDSHDQHKTGFLDSPNTSWTSCRRDALTCCTRCRSDTCQSKLPFARCAPAEEQGERHPSAPDVGCSTGGVGPGYRNDRAARKTPSPLSRSERGGVSLQTHLSQGG